MAGAPEAVGGRRPFFLLWLGQAVSMVGDAIFQITLLLWVADITDSPAAVGALFAVEAIPIFLVSPIAGVFVDRWSYKKTLIYSDLVRAALVSLLVLVQGDGLLWLIYLDVLFISTATRFFFPALMASLPVVVGEEGLPRATSSIRATLSVAFIIGPVMAAPLFVYAGPEIALFVNALSFLISAAALTACRFDQPPVPATTGGLAEVRRELVEGINLVRSSRLQATALGAGVLLLLGGGLLNAINLFFVSDALDQPRSFIGIFSGLHGLGYALGALAMLPLVKRYRLWKLTGLGMLAMGLCIAGYSQVYVLAPALLLYSLYGLGNGLADTANQTFVIQRTPAAARGRVISLHTMAAYGSVILASAAGGFLAEAVDIRWLVGAAAVLCFVAGAFALWSFARLPAWEKVDVQAEDNPIGAAATVV